MYDNKEESGEENMASTNTHTNINGYYSKHHHKLDSLV
jgi:hypothetical protein